MIVVILLLTALLVELCYLAWLIYKLHLELVKLSTDSDRMVHEFCDPDSDYVSRSVVLNKKVHRIMYRIEGCDIEDERVRSGEKKRK